jgi:hypothetical protein
VRPAWAKSSQDPILTKRWAWRFMLAIPATQEAEIGRMAVLGQLRRKKKKKVRETPRLNRKRWAWWCCHPSYSRKRKIGGSWSRLAQAKSEILSLKLPEQNGLEAWLKWQSTCLGSSTAKKINK